MRKFYSLLLLLAASIAFSQVVITPGIRGGANFAKFKESDSGIYDFLDASDEYWANEEKVETKYITDFYVGGFLNFRFSKVYALQPEFNYSRQGSIMKTSAKEEKIQLHYLSLQFMNKFYIQKFNLQAGLGIDHLINDKNYDPYAKKELDLGILVGAGFDITKNFGIEARFKKGLVPIIKTTSEDHTNLLFQAGVYYNFNTKK